MERSVVAISDDLQWLVVPDPEGGTNSWSVYKSGNPNGWSGVYRIEEFVKDYTGSADEVLAIFLAERKA